MSSSLSIIFQDNQLLGYVADEVSAKTSISELADRLVSGLRRDGIRVFRETIDNVVNIYTQAVGSYFNGPVVKQHTVSWQPLQRYEIQDLLDCEKI